MRLARLLLIVAVASLPTLAFAQTGGRIVPDPVAINAQGQPIGGATVSVCQPLATTSASVSGNLATFTMASNPVTAGFAAGMTLQVTGFTGGDTYFNAGTLTGGSITGGYTILVVSSTTVTVALTHANASASTNGTLLQMGNANTSCGGLSTIYTDASLATTTANPFTTDGLGNYGVGAAAGIYYVQVYGSGVTPRMQQTVVACVAGPCSTPVTIGSALCSVATLSAAVGTVPVGGTVDARGCTTAFTWGTTLTLSQPITLYMPCANVTFTVQLLAITSDDVHIHFCGGGTSGQIANYTASTAGSTYTASGLSGTTDAIVAAKTTRGSQNAARLSGLSIDNAVINMGSSGRRAIYMSSAWSSKLDHIVVYNQTCSDGGIYQEADEASDGTLFAASYFADWHDIVSQVASGNTTCHPFYFDSTNGEIAYGTYVGLFAEGFAAAAGSGSDSFYITTGSSNVNQSFDQDVFVNLKAQDPVASAYGVKLQCRGNFVSGTGGRCFDLTFTDPQPERIFSTGGSGVGIGCVNNGGSADGTGCGSIIITTDSAGGWATNEDSTNLGAGFVSNANQGSGPAGPYVRYSGPVAGSSAQYVRMDHTFTPTGASQNLFSLFIVPNVNKGGVGVTGTQLFVGPNCDMGDATVTGSGTVALGSCFNCNTATWATVNYCYSGNGTFNFVEGSAPNVVASSDNCGGVAATHSFQCSFNGDGPFTIARDITATSSAFATATTAGTCVQNVTAVTGAATSMAVAISPVSTPGVGAIWSAFVSSAGNVTINECAVATSAGGTIAFNIRVIP